MIFQFGRMCVCACVRVCVCARVHVCASVSITGECAFETSCHYGEKGFHLYCLPEVLSFKSVQLDCTLLPDDSVLESAGQTEKDTVCTSTEETWRIFRVKIRLGYTAVMSLIFENQRPAVTIVWGQSKAFYCVSIQTD